MRNLVLIITLLCGIHVSARNRQNFDESWLFSQHDTVQMSQFAFNDQSWRRLSLPHDWAIEGDFLASNPSGAGGGALPGGIGWYRKHFAFSKDEIRKIKDERIFIDFDGVYMNSTVYVNGHKLGNRPYGFSSFEYELTPYLIPGDNVIAVRVDNNDQPNCRWYSGCGIYRHVWLVRTSKLRIDHWGVFVRTGVDGSDVQTKIVNETGKERKVTVKNSLIDAQGQLVATSSKVVDVPVGVLTVEQHISATDLHLWSVDTPYLYKVKTELLSQGNKFDAIETMTGMRTFKFDARTGLSLNGVSIKINGVCLHHDLGCLGAAIDEDALHRQLITLKNMGCNAIRCSHNPPAPELLDMCDSMGFIVMDESFDMWRRKKTQNDYARFFDKWFERDLSDMVLRDRNHPSVMIWSIGNEVLEQWSSADADTLSLEQANLILNAGHDASSLAKSGETSVNSLLTSKLAGVVKSLDSTRPVSAGCNEPSPDNHLFKSGALDLIGFNYHRKWVKDVPKNFPDKPFFFSESVSALQTRGFYMMPSDSMYVAPKEWWIPYTDPSYQCSAYDNMHASWSSTHEQTWDIVKRNPYVAGQFIWTGWDYIGEPTPYSYPAKSSYFGIVDLAGFPKDIYYMYQSEWTEKPVLHLFPHWNWIEGDTIDMWCYYNDADEVELFINGKSQGVRRKTEVLNDSCLLNSPYHVGWRVKYEPGEVKAVARKAGREIRSVVIKTAESPDHIKLTRTYDGRKTDFITVEVVDKNGNVCPWAENQIYFSLDKGEIAGVDNGCQTSLERFVYDVGNRHHSNRKAFYGKCLVVVRTEKGATLTAKAVGLKSCSIILN